MRIQALETETISPKTNSSLNPKSRKMIPSAKTSKANNHLNTPPRLKNIIKNPKNKNNKFKIKHCPGN